MKGITHALLGYATARAAGADPRRAAALVAGNLVPDMSYVAMALAGVQPARDALNHSLLALLWCAPAAALAPGDYPLLALGTLMHLACDAVAGGVPILAWWGPALVIGIPGWALDLVEAAVTVAGLAAAWRWRDGVLDSLYYLAAYAAGMAAASPFYREWPAASLALGSAAAGAAARLGRDARPTWKATAVLAVAAAAAAFAATTELRLW